MIREKLDGLRRRLALRKDHAEGLRALPPGEPRFDAIWYLAAYPDVADAELDPLSHYLEEGADEGRQPCPYFDPLWYLHTYPDVRESGMDPYRHYLLFGAAECRQAIPQFDPAWYQQTYPDVADSGLDPLTHFITLGAKEGRQPTPDFDPNWYVTAHADVASSGLDPYWHFLTFGLAEGRAGRATKEPIWGLGLAELRPPVRPTSFSRETYETVLNGLNATRDPRRITVFEWSVPTPDRDSGSLRMSRLIRMMLDCGYTVDLCVDQPAPDARYASTFEDIGVGVHVGPQAIQRFLQNAGSAVDTIWLTRPMTAAIYLPVVKAYCPGAQLIYDTVDVHWLRVKRQSEFDPRVDARESDQVRLQELLYCRVSDAVVTVTDADRECLADAGVTTPLTVVPNVHRVNPEPRSAPQNSDLVFLGNFDHAPNRDAVNYFISDVLPIVRRQAPSARLLIVGSRLQDWMKISESEGVLPMGYVKDLREIMRSTRAMVVPLRFGAGMKGKVGSALEEGLPVVTTSVGAEGMGLIHGEHALIADEPDEIASGAARLCNDDELWLRLSKNGRSHLKERYSEEAVTPVLIDLLAKGTRS